MKIKKFLFHLNGKRELFAVIVLYTIFICIFFSKAFLSEYIAGDWVRFWVPNYYYVLSYLREGILPLWQPYSYLGVPAFFHPGYMLAYPLVWVPLLANFFFNSSLSLNILGKSLELYLYAHYLIGGVSMYFLIKEKLKLNSIAAFSGGFIYIFSVYSVSNLDPTLIGKMYLPLLIYLLLNFLQKPTFLNLLLWIAINWGIFILGYPYYQIYFCYIQVFMGLLYGFRSALLVIGGLIMTGILTAFVLLPQAYYYMQAARLTEATQSVFHITSSPFPTFLLNVLAPTGIYWGNILTWGTIPLIFLIVGFAHLQKNKFTIWLIGVFIVSLVLGLGGYIGIQNLLGGPPFFLDKLRSHGQIFILTFFSGTIILSCGIDAAIRGAKNTKIESYLWLFCLFVISQLLLVPTYHQNYLTEYRDILISLGRFLVLFIVGLIVYHFIVRFKTGLLVGIMLLITLLEFNYYYANTEPNKLGATYNQYFARNSLIPEIPTKDNLFRYEFWGNQFAYNSSQLRVFTSSGYDGIPYSATYDITRFPQPKNYQFANVKYIVTTQENTIPEYKLLYKVNPIDHPNETLFSVAEGFTSFTATSKNMHYVYQVKDYLPRFFVPNEVKSCMHKDCYKKENPPKLVYTKDKGVDIKNPSAKKVSLKVVSYTPNEVVLEVTTPQKTFISSSEIWDKGWSISVNDDKETVYNVNNGFRGFIVPAGKSTVIMSYFPPYLQLGFMLSFLGIVLLVMFYTKRNILK